MKKQRTKRKEQGLDGWIWSFGGLAVLTTMFLITRLWNLTQLPIFNDEAIYLDWGWRMISSNETFLSLYDGKQPLLMWIFGFSQQVFGDPLWAGRIVSVLFGLVGLVGVWKIGLDFFGRRFGLLAVIFYTFSPILVFYDRQVLMESAIGALAVWSVWVCLWILKENKVEKFVLLGVVWALGVWIKSTMVVFVVVEAVGLVWVWINPGRSWLSALLCLKLRKGEAGRSRGFFTGMTMQIVGVLLALVFAGLALLPLAVQGGAVSNSVKMCTVIV